MAKKEFPAIPDEKRLEQLCKNSVRLVEYMRSVAVSQIDYVQIITYFILGKWIVEEQQNGQDRAAYGKKIINCLSERMSAEFDHGFSRSTLQNIRQFYRTYKDRILQPVVSESDFQKRQPVVGILNEKPAFALSWTHYLILMRIKNKEERDFYEAEAISQHWGKRELQRQYSSCMTAISPQTTSKDTMMDSDAKRKRTPLTTFTAVITSMRKKYVRRCPTGSVFNSRLQDIPLSDQCT